MSPSAARDPQAVALFILLASALFYYFSYPEVDPDLWGHLFFGGEILGKGLPTHNLYSFTAPGYEWINHEWLAEVIFFLIYQLFGAPGLIAFKVLCGMAVVLLVHLLLKAATGSMFSRTMVLVWVMAIVSPGFNIRPQLFTYVLFALVLYFLQRSEEGARLHGLPLVMALWVNLHGGFAAGVGAALVFLGGTVVRDVISGQGVPSQFKRLLIPMIVSGVVLVVNPYGWKLVYFVAQDLLLDRAIGEWEPLPLTNLSFLETKAALLLIVVFFRRDHLKRWDFWLMVLSALFALRHQRHTPLFGIAAAPFLCLGVERLEAWVKRFMPQWLPALCAAAAMGYPLYLAGVVHVRHGFQLVVNPGEYPTQAADFLKRNHFRGNIAVPFDWGEYFIWKFYPELRVSIDGRYTTAYPLQVIEDHWEWMRGGKNWKRLLEAYPAEIAVTKRSHPVTALMRQEPEWIYVYSDPAAFVFVRKTSSQATILEAFGKGRLVHPKSPPLYFPG